MDKTKWKAALIRAERTMIQTALAVLGTGTVGLLSVDWENLMSMVIMGGLVSLLTSWLAGLPEVDELEENKRLKKQLESEVAE